MPARPKPPSYALKLAEELDSAGSTSFACGGTFEGVDTHAPLLSVDGIDGSLPLPLTPAAVQSLIAVCEQAPFGLGEDTVVDTDVRRTWQIAADKVHVLNSPSWDQTMSACLSHVCDELGLADSARVQAQLHKLLLYEPGGFFKPHKDSEKAEGMFGTLVINLPSDYDGGALLVRHNGQQHKYGWEQLGAPEESLSYVAFYADCEHEVEPVTRGYRLCLTYNLVLVGPGPSPPGAPPTEPQSLARLSSLMQEWQADAQAPPFLVYMLEHEYTNEGARVNGAAGLKGNDIARGQLLQALSGATGAGLALVRARCHAETGDYEDYDDLGFDFGFGFGGYQAAKSQFLKPNSPTTVSVDFWVHVAGAPLEGMGRTHVEKKQILPVDAFNNRAPAKEEPRYTGNEGYTLDRWYRRSAFVIWPAAKRGAMMLRSRAAASLLAGELSTRTAQLLAQQHAPAHQQQQQQQQGGAVGAGGCVQLPPEAAADLRALWQALMTALDPKHRPKSASLWGGGDEDDVESSDSSGAGPTPRERPCCAVDLPALAPALEGLVKLGLQEEVGALVLAAARTRTEEQDLQVLLPFFTQHFCPTWGWAAAAPVLEQLVLQELQQRPGDSWEFGGYYEQDSSSTVLWGKPLSELLLGLLDLTPLQVPASDAAAAGRAGASRGVSSGKAAAAAPAPAAGGAAPAPHCLAQMQQVAESLAAAAAVRAAASKLAAEAARRAQRWDGSYTAPEVFAAAFQLLAVLGLAHELQQLLHAMRLAPEPHADTTAPPAASAPAAAQGAGRRGRQKTAEEAAADKLATARALAPASLAIGAWLGPDLLHPSAERQFDAAATEAVGCYRALAESVCAQLQRFVAPGPPKAADKYVLMTTDDSSSDPAKCLARYSSTAGQPCSDCASARAFLQDGKRISWRLPGSSYHLQQVMRLPVASGGVMRYVGTDGKEISGRDYSSTPASVVFEKTDGPWQQRVREYEEVSAQLDSLREQDESAGGGGGAQDAGTHVPAVAAAAAAGGGEGGGAGGVAARGAKRNRQGAEEEEEEEAEAAGGAGGAAAGGGGDSGKAGGGGSPAAGAASGRQRRSSAAAAAATAAPAGAAGGGDEGGAGAGGAAGVSKAKGAKKRMK